MMKNKKAFTFSCKTFRSDLWFAILRSNKTKSTQTKLHSYGFTLAEVLITLTTLGVIAAITIPNLIQNNRKNYVETSIAKIDATLQKAITTSEIENGYTSTWNFNYNNKDLPENKILPYLNVSKKCGYIRTPNDCFSNVEGLNGPEQDSNGAAGGYFAILADGTSISINPRHYGVAFIYVDINGPKKGDGIYGKDIFAFTIVNRNVYYANGQYFCEGFGGAWGEFCNISSIEKLLSNNVGGGGCNMESSGRQCTAVIAKNGFKIPKNYPIKNF